MIVWICFINKFCHSKLLSSNRWRMWEFFT